MLEYDIWQYKTAVWSLIIVTVVTVIKDVEYSSKGYFSFYIYVYWTNG